MKILFEKIHELDHSKTIVEEDGDTINFWTAEYFSDMKYASGWTLDHTMKKEDFEEMVKHNREAQK